MAFSDFFQIAVSAMIPVTEMQGTIPFFLATRGDLSTAFVMSAAILGNMAPAFFLLWFFPRFTDWLHDEVADWINRIVHGLHDFFLVRRRMWIVYAFLALVLVSTQVFLAWLGLPWWWYLAGSVIEFLGFLLAFLVLRKVYSASLSHKSVIHWFYEKVHADHSQKFYRYGAIALFLAVAAPLPGTGVWSGSLLAFLFGIPYWRALGLIFVGLIVTAILMTGATTGIISFF